MPNPIIPGERQGDSYPYEATVLSGEPIDSFWHGRFVIDLATMKYHKPRCAVSYNHNDEIIIGYGENFTVTPDGLKANGTLIAGSFADTVVDLAKQGVPFEASVDIELNAGTATHVAAGNTITVNGKTQSGPLTMYSDVPLRGFAICPYGADKFTNLTMLKKEHDYLMTKPKKMNADMTKLSDMAEAAPETPPAKTVKDAVLAEFCEVFGTEKGLELYQSDASIDEVRQWKALNEKFAAYLADEEKTAAEDKPADPPENKTEETPADPPTKEDDKLSATLTTLSKNFETLTKTVEKQAAQLTQLRSEIPKGAEPVSHGNESAPVTKLAKSNVDKYAEKYKDKK